MYLRVSTYDFFCAMRGLIEGRVEERKKTGELSLGRAQKDKVRSLARVPHPSPTRPRCSHTLSQSKPLTMRQHALASALEEASGTRTPSPEPLTHVEEQSKLRDETIAAFHTAVDGEERSDEEDDLLVLREKTKDEIEKEEEEYRAYLQREVGEDLSELITIEPDSGVGAVQAEEEERPKKKGKKEKKTAKSGKSKQDEDQEFLLK